MSDTSRKRPQYPIAEELLSITQEQVVQLDQEIADGEGWEFYSKGFVSGATVFQDTILGQVRELTAINTIEIKVRNREIYTSCSCSRTGGICKHAIALLYCWTNDNDSFINVGTSLEKLEKFDKEELLNILKRILVRDPQYITLAFGRFGEEESDVFFDDFLGEDDVN